MQTHDKLGRRNRVFPVSTGKRLTLNERDVFLLDKIHRHGPLSSTYLLAFTTLAKVRGYSKTHNRLTELFNEDETEHGMPYLSRPFEQFNTLDPRYNPIVYDLTDGAIEALKERELWSKYAPSAGGSWKHKYMTSCITASIELETLKTENVRYIHQDEILARADSKLSFQTKIHGTNQNLGLHPDALFGLEYHHEGKAYYRFFIVEADRSTEPSRATSFDRKTYERTIRQYHTFIGDGQYKKDLNMNAGLMVLNVTTGHRRTESLLALTNSLFPQGNSYLLFQHIPHFSQIFKPPPILSHLYTQEYHRAGTPFNIGTIDGLPPKRIV